MIDLDKPLPIDWHKLFSHEHFQQGWFDARAGKPRVEDYDSGFEYALGRCFAIESGVDFPRYSGELPAIFARCPASVSELQISLRREAVDIITKSIDGFVFLAWDYLGWPNTGSVTRGDAEHAGFTVKRRRK